MAEPTVTHLFTHIRGLSGVESMVRRHLRNDVIVGFQPSAISFFERGEFTQARSGQQVSGLGLTGSCQGLTLRRRFRAVIPEHPPGIRVFHEGWGLASLADLDTAQRRVAFLHSHWTGAENFFRGLRGLVDGILCVSPALQNAIQMCLPDLPPERIRVVQNPVDPPPREFLATRPEPRRELVVGYCGRVVRPAKRVDRLPELAQQLHRQGLPHTWEILGDGLERPALESSMAQTGVKVRFHGGQTGEAFWKILSSWDVIVFTSDFEGMPLALLEAMSVGVLPVFPRLASGGRDTTERIASELIYTPGDLADAARAITWLAGRSSEDLAQLRLRSQAVIAPHAGSAYNQAFAEFLHELQQQPRLSASGPTARRPHLGEWIPYTVIKRFAPSSVVRRGYL